MSTVIREHRRGRLRWLTLDRLEREGVTHGFTLRRGGASRGRFSSLNFTSRQDDLPERVKENWRRLEEAADLPSDRWALVSQVHGNETVVAEEFGRACHHRHDHPGADGVVVTRRRSAAGVLTADCLPVVIGLPGGEAVAVVHAGWRGSVDGVAAGTVKALAEAAHAEPGEMIAALGPAVGSCCYQVGDSVREAVRDRWGEGMVRRVLAKADPWRLDLQLFNRIQLREAGLKNSRIDAVPLCTVCRSDLFFSHRRDGERTGRMMNFVMRR